MKALRLGKQGLQKVNTAQRKNFSYAVIQK